MPWKRAWLPTPTFLLGESQGQRSLVGYSPQGHRESDMSEATQHAHFQALNSLFWEITARFSVSPPSQGSPLPLPFPKWWPRWKAHYRGDTREETMVRKLFSLAFRLRSFQLLTATVSTMIISGKGQISLPSWPKARPITAHSSSQPSPSSHGICCRLHTGPGTGSTSQGLSLPNPHTSSCLQLAQFQRESRVHSSPAVGLRSPFSWGNPVLITSDSHSFLKAA